MNQGRPPSRGGYSRGRGYYRGGKPNTIHRNRTLVLNNANAGSKPDGAQDDSSGAAAPAPAWVTKTDRHMQLINPAIYEKQSQDRARAIEETRKLRLKQRDDREKFKLSKHLERLSDNMAGHSANQRVAQALPNYEITVQGIRFRVMKDGSKLAKVPGDENAAKLTPKSATVGGVRFYRSKNGNLYRSGIVKAQRYDLRAASSRDTLNRFTSTRLTHSHTRQPAAIKKIDEPCRLFSTTGTSLSITIPTTISTTILKQSRNTNFLVSPHTELTDTFRHLPQGPTLPLHPRPRQSRHLQGLSADGRLRRRRLLRPLTRGDPVAHACLSTLRAGPLRQRELSVRACASISVGACVSRVRGIRIL